MWALVSFLFFVIKEKENREKMVFTKYHKNKSVYISIHIYIYIYIYICMYVCMYVCILNKKKIKKTSLLEILKLPSYHTI